MWRAERLPAKHGPLRIMPAASPLRVGPQHTGTTGWPEEEVPTSTCICWWRDGFRYPSNGVRNHSQAIQCFQWATGAQLNTSKSKAMALGGWKEPATELGIDVHDSIKVLVVGFGPTIPQSMNHSWSDVIHAVRAQARRAYEYTRSLV